MCKGVKDGFNLIKTLKTNNTELNIEIDMIMGNHDYEDTTDHIIENRNNEKILNSSCIITGAEISNTKGNLIDLSFFKARLIANKTLIIMMDTSIYVSAKEFDDYQNCVDYFLNEKFPNKNNEENLEKETPVEKQQNFLKTIVEKILTEKILVNKIIFIGHHPLGHFKLKKDETNFTTDIPNIFPVLMKIHQDLIDKNIKYYYLCADFHSYQHGLVTLENKLGIKMTIEQFISGTGGTKLDDEINDREKEKTVFFDITKKTDETNPVVSIKYKFFDNIKNWGYLIYDTDDEKERIKKNVEFIKVEKTTFGGKKSRKNRKNRKNRKSIKNGKRIKMSR